MILVDTDIVIDLLRGYQPAFNWLSELKQTDKLGISGFSALELIEGCLNQNELRRIQNFLEDFTIIWLSPEQCDRAMARFARERLRYGADMIDTLVAETALQEFVPLNTFNAKHFRHIDGLAIQRPYQK